RIFCRSLIITETQVRLLHYDRSGAFITEFINFHRDPHTFVRLVLGLSSLDEEKAGLDTSVKWTVDGSGRKCAGTISAVDDITKAETTYNLIMEEPPVIRNAISGTGVTCWNARCPDGKRFIIKDYWRAGGRTPENEFLKRVKNVKGIVTSVESFEAKRAKTKDFRPANFASKNFHNRILSRMALSVPGQSLLHFASQQQAIRAIRDAIQGHCNLLIAHILHRDITVHSILLINEREKDCPSGILTDLATAIPAEGEKDRLSPDGRTGSKMFQSYAIMRCSWSEPKLGLIAQDYLDDLESMFWVLCYL
ncbi:hypothetical protein DFP72DRAFT_748093, partial [Ephemerocybe angulata]